MKGKDGVVVNQSTLTQPIWDENITKLHNAEKQSFKIQRKPAQQVIPFLLANPTRLSYNNAPHAIPCSVIYAGKDFDNKYCREAVQNVKNKIYSIDPDAKVLLTCSDGEFIGYIVKDANGVPRTVLQFSKSHWTNVSKLSKKEIFQKTIEKKLILDLDAKLKVERKPPLNKQRNSQIVEENRNEENEIV